MDILEDRVVPTFTLSNPGTQLGYDGDAVNMSLTAHNSSLHTLSYSATNLPAGLSVSAGTFSNGVGSAIISGTIASNADAPNPFSVTITATDTNTNATVSQTFSWHVLPTTVTLTQPNDQINCDGDVVSLHLSASDNAHHALTYAESGLPAPLSINANTGIISGTIGSNDTLQAYSVTVTATDGAAGVSASKTFNWTLVAIEAVLSNPGDQSNSDGDTVSLTIVAKTSYASAGIFTFGETGLPANLSLNNTSGVISGTIANKADQASPYAVTVSVTDTSSQLNANEGFNWTVYHLPATTGASLSVEEGDSIPSIDLSQYASGGDGQPLQVSLVTAPTEGQLIYNGDGTYAYDAPTDWTGTDSFTFQATDGTKTSNVATVTVSVTQYAAVNPDGSYSVLANQTLPEINFAQNDSNANGDPTQIVIVSGPSNGSLIANSDGTYDYTPTTNYVGADVVTVEANGGPQVNVTINVTDEPPIAFPTSYDVNNNGTFTVSSDAGVLASCVDNANNPFNAVLVFGVADGSLTLNSDGSFSYTPTPGFVGTDSFVYAATDGMQQSNSAIVTLNVTADSAPSAGDTSFSVLHDQPLSATAPGLLEYVSDTDGAPLTVALFTGPSDGTLALDSDGTFTYTPASGYVGTDSFTYEAYDGIYYSAPATVTITVTDNAPSAPATYFSTPAGQALSVSASNGVLASAFDVDGDAMTAQLLTPTANGSLTLNSDGSFTYTPTQGFTGNDTFTYAVSDGIMASDPVTCTITVAGNTPVANDDYFATGMNTPLTISGPGVLANDTGGATLSAALDTGPADGSVSLNSDGSFTYTPTSAFTGTDSFTYFAQSSGNQSPTPGIVRIGVGNVTLNLPPAQWTQGPWVFFDAGDYNGSAWQTTSSNVTINGTLNGTTFTPNLRPGTANYFVPGLLVTAPGVPAGTTVGAVNTAQNPLTVTLVVPPNLRLTARGQISLKFSNPTSVNIPTTRDYASPQQLPNNRTDPLLLPINVNLTVPAGFVGYIRLQAQTNGTGKVRIWSDQRKTILLSPGSYALNGANALPATIYVEGTSPTAVALNQQNQGNPAPDFTITVSLVAVIPIGQGAAILGPTISGQATVGVSPVVTNYAIASAQPQGFSNAVNFQNGFTSAAPGQFAQANQAAQFSAQVYDPNAPAQSQAQFVQIMTTWNGAFFGFNNDGFVFVPNRNLPDENWRLSVNGQITAGSNPFDDLGVGPGPFYTTPLPWASSSQAQNQPVYQISNTDSPQLDAAQLRAVGLARGALNGAGFVNQAGFAFNFSDFLVWQMPVPAGSGPLQPTTDTRPATAIFTLAQDTWSFAFQAWGQNANVVANNQSPSVILGNPIRSSEDPKITGPSANSALNIG
jgi:hypothetical protein